MPRFPSEQLQTFAIVLAEGTLEAAARRLHITSSAVSQRLKALEEGAGQVLLQRSNPVEATAAGEVVLRLARQVAQLEDDAGRELGFSADSAAHVPMPIAVNADSLAVWFLRALAEVPSALNVTFELHRDDEQHSTGLLRSGTVMAAVTATPEPVQGCRVEPLGVMRYRAVAAPHFVSRWLPGLVDGGMADAPSLNAAPAVDFDRKDTYQRLFIRRLARMTLGSEGASQLGPHAQPQGDLSPGPRHYVPASQDFADAIRLGLGWGLIPEDHCGPDLADGTLLELAPHDPFDVALYWQRWKIQSPLLDKVSAIVRAVATDHLRQLPEPS